MRPCPNCECFVADAARRCPRCAAELEPVEVPEVAAVAEAEPDPEPAISDERDQELALVGSMRGAAATTGTTDPIVRSVMARVALAPMDGPASTRRPHGLPKLPQPFERDPLVLAVFLGIPMGDSETRRETEPARTSYSPRWTGLPRQGEPIRNAEPAPAHETGPARASALPGWSGPPRAHEPVRNAEPAPAYEAEPVREAAPAPVVAPTRPPTSARTSAADEPAADLSPATIAAIMEAAAEITAGGVSARWSPHDDVPDAALEKVIAGADAVVEQVAHLPAPTARTEAAIAGPDTVAAPGDAAPADLTPPDASVALIEIAAPEPDHALEDALALAAAAAADAVANTVEPATDLLDPIDAEPESTTVDLLPTVEPETELTIADLLHAGEPEIEAATDDLLHTGEPEVEVTTDDLLHTGGPEVEATADDLLPARQAEPEPEPAPEAALAPAPAPAPAATVVPATQPDPEPTAPSEAAISATPIAPPLVLTAPEIATQPTRRRLFKRRDAFTRRATKRERLLTRICLWLALALGLGVFATRLPLGARPQLGASTNQTDGSVGSPESPVSTPFADAIRIQTRADLQVVVTEAERLDAAWKSYTIASPALLARSLPQFEFADGSVESTRVGEMSVASSNGAFAIAEYAGPKACAYARITPARGEEAVIGATGTTCRASDQPATGWGPLDEG